LKKREILLPFELMLISFIKNKLQHVRDQDDLLESLNWLLKECVAIKDRLIEAPILEEFAIIEWLEAKIEGKPLVSSQVSIDG
jgi:hypothetical protein